MPAMTTNCTAIIGCHSVPKALINDPKRTNTPHSRVTSNNLSTTESKIDSTVICSISSKMALDRRWSMLERLNLKSIISRFSRFWC